MCRTAPSTTTATCSWCRTPAPTRTSATSSTDKRLTVSPPSRGSASRAGATNADPGSRRCNALLIRLSRWDSSWARAFLTSARSSSGTGARVPGVPRRPGGGPLALLPQSADTWIVRAAPQSGDIPRRSGRPGFVIPDLAAEIRCPSDRHLKPSTRRNSSAMNPTSKTKIQTKRTLLRSTLTATLTATIATTLAAGVLLAEAGSAEAGTLTSVERYRATLGPLQSVGLPDMTCPAGTYLHNANYSPGRLVPPGVQVVENGGVGVSMSGATVAAVQPKGLPLGVEVKDTTAAPASATNWSLSSRELVIILVCTTNPYNAVYYDPYHEWS